MGAVDHREGVVSRALDMLRAKRAGTAPTSREGRLASVRDWIERCVPDTDKRKGGLFARALECERNLGPREEAEEILLVLAKHVWDGKGTLGTMGPIRGWHAGRVCIVHHNCEQMLDVPAFDLETFEFCILAM